MKTFQKSEAYLARAQRCIPLGSQTFSKSRTQYPLGVSPLFLTRANGARVWDLDGNEYIDYVNALAAITLGYSDPDVTLAVQEQLEQGVIFSLPHPIEAEVAELICEMVPCAEMVRFGKNGSDATAGAIRLARAYTKRDHVLVCGYHGWQDWYIGSTARNAGVPATTQALTHTFAYNDLESLESNFKKCPGQVAAVILEPMNVHYPKPGFLQGIKELCERHGAVLIFDETITGFRYTNGGAQQMFGVTPDLAAFGKGMANGYPVSAVAGRREIMRLMEEIFFSFTFGGETLSLAAAKATLKKLRAAPITSTLAERGQRILDGASGILSQFGLGDIFELGGHPSWTFLIIKDARGHFSYEIRTYLMQELHQSGLLSVGTHNVSYSHTVADVDSLLAAYREILPEIGSLLDSDGLRGALRGAPLVPLFKVR